VSSPQILIIAVCTRARKNMLLSCMEAISQLVQHPNFELSLVVCDNNSEPMSSEYQKALGAAAGFPLVYVHEGQAGIPFARNAALKTACTLQPDWIAFIDDDETIDERWIIEMVQAMEIWPADVYHGWTQSTPEDLNAPWAFHRPRNKRVAGTIMETAGSDNVLFSKAAIDGLKFNEDMRFSGGEDIDFFYRVADRGAKIVWVPTAITQEETPISRLSFSYQVRRAYSVASAQAYIARKRLGTAKALKKVGPKAIGRIFGGFAEGFVSCMILPFNARGGRKMILTSSKKMASAIGLLRGVNMNLGQIYREIDGS